MIVKILKVFYLSVIVFIFSFCSTSIPLTVQRSPSLDTYGIRRIAIIPFEPGSPAYSHAARHATNMATSRIQSANYFTLVSASEIQRLRNNNQSIEEFVDALFSGQITQVSSNVKREQYETSNRETGEVTIHVYYIKEVEVHFNYFFERSRDGSLLGPIFKRGTTNVRADNERDLPSTDSLVSQIIDSQLRNLSQDVAPYTVRINRTLEKEKNKELRPQMDTALSHVKSGSYRLALEAYLAIYNVHKNIAAAVNASILYEALGETHAAADFMRNVFAETGNPRANEVLLRLNRELAETARAAQFNNPSSRVQRAASHASAEISRVLPPNARVWIHNNARENQNIASDVIDNLTASLLRSGITVIERESIALINRELNFQLEGNVNDYEFVSIGQLAGANMIVIVNIAGTGASRRLQIRVLEIERGVPVFQSDTSENWLL